MSILNPFERRSSITPNNYYPFMVQNGSIVPNSLVDEIGRASCRERV